MGPVLLDANVFVSASISPKGAPNLIATAWARNEFEVVVCSQVVEETAEALGKPKIRRRYPHLTEEVVSEAIEDIKARAIWVAVTEVVPVIPEDPDDDVFLAAAVEANAQYIVTGDRHLLNLREYSGIQVLSPADFYEILKRQVKV